MSIAESRGSVLPPHHPLRNLVEPARGDAHALERAARFGVGLGREHERLRARLAELEQNAARRARELTALHESLLEIGQLTDLTTLLQTIVTRAAGLLNAHMGGLYLVHPEEGTLELVVAHNLPRQWVGTVLRKGEGLSGRIVQTGQVMVVSDYQAWEGRAAVRRSLAGNCTERAPGDRGITYRNR